MNDITDTNPKASNTNPTTSEQQGHHDDPLVALRSVTIRYGDNVAVDGIDLSLYPGEIACLLGPSGCGKTTVLRAIAGFEPVCTGEISIADVTVANADMMMPPEQRNIGLVFQDFALFPHLTIAKNIAFGLSGMNAAERQARVSELLDLVGLPGFESRYPHSLSGGQQQRIALARAIAPKPRFLLMDEPFSSLDVDMRHELVPQVREILLKEGIAGLLVTHDQLEAFTMADRIAVMRAGKIEQYDSGFELYHRPASQFVADFIGQGTFINATVQDDKSVNSDLGLLQGKQIHGFPVGDKVQLLIRPDDVVHDDDSALQGRIVSKRFEGKNFLYELCIKDCIHVYCHASSHHDHHIGEWMGVRLMADDLVMFAVEAQQSIEMSTVTDNVERAH